MDHLPQRSLNTIWMCFRRDCLVLDLIQIGVLYGSKMQKAWIISLSTAMAKTLWRRIPSLLGNTINNASNIATRCKSLCCLNLSSPKKHYHFQFISVVICICRNLWLGRNNCFFNNSSNRVIKLWENICSLVVAGLIGQSISKTTPPSTIFL